MKVDITYHLILYDLAKEADVAYIALYLITLLIT